MNTEAVMIGGKRVTFQKVEGSNGFFEDVADKKILKQNFLVHTQDWAEWDSTPLKSSAIIRAQQQLAMGWTVRGSDPVGFEFPLTRTDKP